MTELTDREQEILNLISEGYSSKQIADMFGTAYQTVVNQRLSILRKTGSNNITQAFKVVVLHSSKLLLK